MIRPTRALIDLGALAGNVQVIRRRLRPETRIMAVVKANCYGHDANLCVPELRRLGIDIFATASVEEARRLRSIGVDERIVVLGPPLEGQYDDFAEHGIEALISNRRMAEALAATADRHGRRLAVHLFVDTGMGRNGAAVAEVLETLQMASDLPSLEVVGFSSHFATSDELDSPFVREQLRIFDGALRSALDAGHGFRDIHIANSGGILNVPDSHYTLVRPGLSLYGYHPTLSLQKESGLRPVMSWRTVIANMTRMPKGVSISYGRRYYTSEETTIATLPVGYADGLMRILTNRLGVLVGGRRFPVVGTICMDEVMVDLGDAEGISVGDEVLLIGESGGLGIDAWEMAEAAGTIPYEICTNVSARVPRIAHESASASRTHRILEGN